MLRQLFTVGLLCLSLSKAATVSVQVYYTDEFKKNSLNGSTLADFVDRLLDNVNKVYEEKEVPIKLKPCCIEEAYGIDDKKGRAGMHINSDFTSFKWIAEEIKEFNTKKKVNATEAKAALLNSCDMAILLTEHLHSCNYRGCGSTKPQFNIVRGTPDCTSMKGLRDTLDSPSKQWISGYFKKYVDKLAAIGDESNAKLGNGQCPLSTEFEAVPVVGKTCSKEGKDLQGTIRKHVAGPLYRGRITYRAIKVDRIKTLVQCTQVAGSACKSFVSGMKDGKMVCRCCEEEQPATRTASSDIKLYHASPCEGGVCTCASTCVEKCGGTISGCADKLKSGNIVHAGCQPGCKMPGTKPGTDSTGGEEDLGTKPGTDSTGGEEKDKPSTVLRAEKSPWKSKAEAQKGIADRYETTSDKIEILDFNEETGAVSFQVRGDNAAANHQSEQQGNVFVKFGPGKEDEKVPDDEPTPIAPIIIAILGVLVLAVGIAAFVGYKLKTKTTEHTVTEVDVLQHSSATQQKKEATETPSMLPESVWDEV